MFESGVKFYTHCKLKTSIDFPEDITCCWYCVLFNKHTEECRITNETIYRPKQFIGSRCPLELEERNE